MIFRWKTRGKTTRELVSTDARVESAVEFTRELVSTDTRVELSEPALAIRFLASNKH